MPPHPTPESILAAIRVRHNPANETISMVVVAFSLEVVLVDGSEKPG